MSPMQHMGRGHDRIEEEYQRPVPMGSQQIILGHQNKRNVKTSENAKRSKGVALKVQNLNDMVQIVKKRPKMKHVEKVAYKE
jgi:hypothetical protein